MKKHILVLSLLASAGCHPKVYDRALISNSGSDAIVGGQTVDKEIFAKHVVAIHNADLGSWCTGTLISKDTVVTAAHCIDMPTAASYVIHFGKSPRDYESVTRNALAMKANAGYNAVAYEDRKDIGVIRFQGSLPEGFEPMPLPTEQDLGRIVGEFYTAGYGSVTGRNDIPRDSGILRYTRQKIRGGKITTTQSQFVVDQRNGHGICFGDSGGPAFAKFDGRRILIGVASAVYSTDTRGKERADFDLCRYNAIYTSVFYYLDWIKKASASLH